MPHSQMRHLPMLPSVAVRDALLLMGTRGRESVASEGEAPLLTHSVNPPRPSSLSEAIARGFTTSRDGALGLLAPLHSSWMRAICAEAKTLRKGGVESRESAC